jgi:hypothetical protein
MPGYMREAFFFAEKDYVNSWSETKEWTYTTAIDTRDYDYVCRFAPDNMLTRTMTYVGPDNIGGTCGPEKLIPPLISAGVPANQITSRSVILNGETSTELPATDGGLPPLPADTSESVGYRGSFKVTLSWFGGVQTVFSGTYTDAVSAGNDSSMWFAASPDAFSGLAQSMWATANALGSKSTLMFTDKPNGEVVMQGEPAGHMAGKPCYLGVINA